MHHLRKFRETRQVLPASGEVISALFRGADLVSRYCNPVSYIEAVPSLSRMPSNLLSIPAFLKVAIA